jgi:hypothetical protein
MESVPSRLSAPPIRLSGAKIELKPLVAVPDPIIKAYHGGCVPVKLIDESPVTSSPLPYPAATRIPVNAPAHSLVHVCDECPSVAPELRYPSSNYSRVGDYKLTDVPDAKPRNRFARS